MLPKPALGRSKSVSPSGDLALTKAAAWAWHQHTTAGTGRFVHPFETGGAAAPPRQRRPSRHKLEADAAAAAAATCPFQAALSRSASFSLLDGYEIRRISMDLDRHILEARSFRQQPEKLPSKRPAKSIKFWARRVVGFFSSRSSRVAEDPAFAPRPLR